MKSINANDWTAKSKKNAVCHFEKEGKKCSVPIMVWLKQTGLNLPPMQKGNRRVFHFEELKYRFMQGKTKEQSMQLVNDYCKEMIDIYNKAVENFKKSQESDK